MKLDAPGQIEVRCSLYPWIPSSTLDSAMKLDAPGQIEVRCSRFLRRILHSRMCIGLGSGLGLGLGSGVRIVNAMPAL